jgi:hypothetical protein
LTEGFVTLSANEVCKLADDLKNIEQRLRQLGTQGFSTKLPTTQVPPFDKIDWWVKEKDTGKNRPANIEDPYAWTFAALRDGTIPEGRKKLLDYLSRNGKAEIQGFEITQSKDGKFLQRKRMGA